MKDRQPTQVLANGAIRYGIYNADGTLDHYEYMKREDAPTVEGTPLNKASLLSDETEAKIWRGNDKPEEPTVNNALNKLADGTAKIGDIAITARTDLSAAWLPCDGRKVTSAQYPELYNILRSSASAMPWQQITLSGVTYGTLPFFVNNLWLCIGLERVANSNSGQTVFLHVYTSGDFSSWTDHRYMIDCISFSDYISSYKVEIQYADVQYSNGNYYIAATIYDGNGYGYSCVFAAMPNDFSACLVEAVVEPSATALRSVCKVQLIVTSISARIIMYTGGWSPDDGYTSYGLTMYYRSNSSSWSNYTVPYTTKYIAQVAYSRAHNVYYAVGDANYKPNTIYKTTDFTNWEEVGTVSADKITFPSGFYGLNAAAIDPDSGLIVLVYANTATNTNYPSAYKHGIFYVYSTDFGVTWSSGKMLTNNSLGGNQADRFLPDTIALKNAFLVGDAKVETDYTLYAASDLNDNMYKATLPTGFSVQNAFAISDSALVVCGDGKGNFFSCDYGTLARPVPTITPDTRSHAYIKALEE